MKIDSVVRAAPDPAVAAILDELAGVVDAVYPITSPIDPRFPVHTRLGTIEVFPDTMTPNAWSSSGSAISRMTLRFLTELGVIPADTKMHFQGVFYGCCGTNISAYVFVNRRLPGAPWWPWSRAARAVIQQSADPIIGWEPPPTVFAWLRDCVWRLRGRARCARIEAELQAKMAPLERALEQAEAESLERDFAALDAAALIAELKRPSLNAELMRLHVGTTHFVGSHYLKLAQAIARWTALDPVQTANALLVALGDVESAKPARALREIARLVAAAPRLAGLLGERRFADFASAIAQPQDAAERRAAEARAGFLREFGYRGIGESTLDATTWAEAPEQADALLALYLGDTDDSRLAHGESRREEMQDAVLAQVASPRHRERLRGYIAKAQTFAAMRERTKSFSVRQSLRTRRLLKALTGRLVADGVFETPEDREMLSFKELTGVLATNRAALRALIARRRKAYTLLRKLDIVEETFSGLPTPRLAGRAGSEPLPVGEAITGIGLSPGIVEGIARVVRDPRQGADIRPGEILVAPYTDAAWSPLFLLASGIVIDSATLISHGATVARELGIPAVAQLPGTTRLLSGDRVRIDAVVGEVRVIARHDAATHHTDVVLEPQTGSALDWSPALFAVLRALRLKGRAGPEPLAVATGFTPEVVAHELARALDAGLCTQSGERWQLTSIGLEWVEEGLAHERPDAALAEALHHDFLPLNALFKQLAFDWQMRDAQTPNDHADAAYDAAVIARLLEIDTRFAAITARAAALNPRLRPFSARFAAALGRVRGGEVPYLMSPRVDSYHTVWFEFHEELIGMTGRTRAAEAAAGRAA